MLVPFVRSVVVRHQGTPVVEDDLVQEGTIGLLKAIDRFDLSRGTRLTTFARPWIEGEIRRALREARFIQLPAAKVAALGRIGRAEECLRGELGREPTTAEVAAAIGMSEDEVVAASGWTVVLEGDLTEGNVRSLHAEPSSPPLRDSGVYSRAEVSSLLEQYAQHWGRLEGTRNPNRAGRRPSRMVPSSNLQPRLLDLEGALEHLPGRLFEAVELVGFYGLGFNEAGRELGIHENTVRHRYRRAIDALTDHLNGIQPLPRRLRSLPWTEELRPIRNLRRVISNYQPFFRKLERLAESDPSLAGLEVGWVLDRRQGWIPLLGKDIGEAARRMGIEVRPLPKGVRSPTAEGSVT
jgi:RNA polymerase sigma factor (sigma-70 family)